jgi:chromosomal replication initiator protein
MGDVVEYAADFYGMSVTRLIKKERTKELVYSRFVTIDYLVKLQTYSLVTIGKYFKRNHATIIHARDRIQELKDLYPEIVNEMKDFKEYMDSKVFEAA